MVLRSSLNILLKAMTTSSIKLLYFNSFEYLTLPSNSISVPGFTHTATDGSPTAENPRVMLLNLVETSLSPTIASRVLKSKSIEYSHIVPSSLDSAFEVAVLNLYLTTGTYKPFLSFSYYFRLSKFAHLHPRIIRCHEASFI